MLFADPLGRAGPTRCAHRRRRRRPGCLSPRRRFSSIRESRQRILRPGGEIRSGAAASPSTLSPAWPDLAGPLGARVRAAALSRTPRRPRRSRGELHVACAGCSHRLLGVAWHGRMGRASTVSAGEGSRVIHSVTSANVCNRAVCVVVVLCVVSTTTVCVVVD